MLLIAVLICVFLTLANLLLTGVLFRQLGLFVMGTARGANDSGIAVGRRMPEVDAVNLLNGQTEKVPKPGLHQLVVFASTNCSECADMYPHLVDYVERYDVRVAHFIFGRDERDLRRFVSKMGIGEDNVFIADQPIGESFDVEATPFAFVLDHRGVVIGKGLVNGREHVVNLASLVVDEPSKERIVSA